MDSLHRIAAVVCCLYLTQAQRVEDNSWCAFPFKYQGRLYSTCITKDHSTFWCATTKDYDTDRKWRDCRDADLFNLPRFNESTKTNITVIVGETAILPCIISNLNAKQVSWQKKGTHYPLTVATRSFFPTEKYSVRNNIPEEWSLVIRDVKKPDRGVYQCRVATRAMSLVREVRLFVKGSKYGELLTTLSATYFEQEGQTNLFLPKGDNLTISCNSTNPYYVRGQRQVIHHNYIVWYKNNEKIDSNTRSGILITNYVKDEVARSVLTIEGMKARHTGNYYCVSNETTIAKFNVHLKDSESKMSQDQPRDGNNYLSTLSFNPDEITPDSLKVPRNMAAASFYRVKTQTIYLSLLAVISERLLNSVYI